MVESHHPLAAGGWSPGGSGGNAGASPASYNTTLQRQRNRRWAVELAAGVVGVGGADLIAKAREVLAFVEEQAPDPPPRPEQDSTDGH